MAKAEIDIVDETFDVEQSLNYHLSIQIDVDSLSFCVFNTAISKYIVLRRYSLSRADSGTLVSECKSVFDNDRVLRLPYRSSGHLWVSQRCTLVPEHLFSDGEANLFLNFNHGVAAGEKTLQNHVAQAGLYNVFSCPEVLIALLKSYQPDIRFFHRATPFIKTVMNAATHLTGKRECLAVSFYSGNMDIGIVENNKLAFYNTFQINAPADAVYYLLVVSNLFSIDLKSTALLYLRNSEQIPPEIAVLADFTGSIADCAPMSSVAYSHFLPESLRKSFINLFNLYECE